MVLLVFFDGQPGSWRGGDWGASLLSMVLLLLLEESARGHGDLFAGDVGGFFEGNDHFGGFIGDEWLVGFFGSFGAGEGLLLAEGRGRSNGLFDGSFALLHGGEVGDVDELRAAVGDNGHCYGDGGLGVRFEGGEVDGSFFAEDTRGGLVLELFGVGAFGIAAVGAGGGFFLTGHVSVMEVALGVGIEAEVLTGHLVAETGRGEVHFLLGLLVVFFDKPDLFLVGAFGAGPWGLSHHVLTTSEDGHDEGVREVLVFAYEMS